MPFHPHLSNGLRISLVIAALAMGVACGPKRAEIQDAPSWKTDEGRRSLKLELIEAFLDHRQTEQAMTLIAQLYAEGATDPVLRLYEGEALMQAGMPGEAERLLLAYSDEKKKDPRPFRLLGVLYADDLRVDDGITALRRAITLEEQHASTWNNLGFLLLSAGRYDEAVPALQRAVELDATQGRYRNNLGFALAGQGRWKEAFEAFRSGGSLADAHSNLGLARELAGDPDKALEHHRRALEYDSEHKASKEAAARLASPEEEP